MSTCVEDGLAPAATAFQEAIGLFIGGGTIAFAFALEGVIRHELWRASQPEPTKPRSKRRTY